MRTGPTCFMTPSSMAGVNGGRYTIEQLAQNPTYERVMRHFERMEGREKFLSGTYADGARMFLPPAIEAAETMLSPEQTAQLCDDAFEHIGPTAFQAFEKYPDIFRAARGRLQPNHILSILEKLTIRGRNTLPFSCLAKAIEGMEGLSSKAIADLISSGIHKYVPPTCAANADRTTTCCNKHSDAGLTFRILDRLAPAYIVSRLRFSSDEDAISFFRLTKKRFGTRSDKVLRAMPGLLSGIDDTYTNEQIVDAITRPKIPGLSPAANAIVALYKIVLFKWSDPNPDLEIEKLIATLKAEGKRSRRLDLPTMGGKISSDRTDFHQIFFDYLNMLGFECREDIFFRHWGEVSQTRNTMLVLPAARSALEASLLIDVLREVGVFRDGAVLRHQITVAGRLVEEAKYIALALHSAQPIPVPYPDMLMSPIKGFDHIAPVVEGGWELTDVNKKGPWFNWRFDLPLLSVYVLMNEQGVLEQAMGRGDDDHSLLEQVLVGVYRKFEARWKQQPENAEPEGASGESDFVEVSRGEGKGAFYIRQMARPKIAEDFFEALEGAYGDDLANVRANHNFNIEATQLLSWAMHSPWLSDQRSVFRYFMAGMHNLYRQAGIESTLKTQWKRRRWEQIYPSLRQLDAIKDPKFHRAVRNLVIETINKLRKIVETGDFHHKKP